MDSDLNQHIPVSSIPIKSAGNINELKGTSQWDAIDALQATLREQTKKRAKKD